MKVCVYIYVLPLYLPSEYKDDEDLIARNSSIIVRRIPMVGVKSSGSKTTSKTMSKTT